MVAGYAIGGGHVLHLVCDLTIAADNARFGQTGPRVGSFDGGYGVGILARTVGQKKASEIWFLCRQYDASKPWRWAWSTRSSPSRTWSRGRSSGAADPGAQPAALRFLKAGLNADTDGLAGIQQLAGNATLLYYMTEEAKEGRNAFLESAGPTSPSSPSDPNPGDERLGPGARRDAGRGHVPRCGGNRRGRRRGAAGGLAGAGRPGRGPGAPGRAELRQRLLRRAARPDTPARLARPG